uniref:peroxidase n=2 Tax=Haemonchus contortus TaxID=6289 RepID=A0A7I4Y6P2_HAECO
MYIIPALPLLLLVLSSQPSVADEDNPVTIRFHCQRGCCDHHEWCRFWASVGECRSNREWMADNCQLVCGSCRPGSTRAPRPPGASAPVRSPPRPPRPGTSQSPNPRPSNARQGGRRPPPRVSMRDPQPFQPRIQDRRPQRPVTTTQLRTTQRTFPFTRPTRPFRPRPNPRVRPPPRQPPSPLRATSPLLPRRFFNRQQSFTTTTRPLPPPPTTRPLPPPTVRTFPPTTQTTTTTTRAPPPSTPNAARCQAIINDPLVAAEEMWREHLVVATEDNSNRKTVDLDAVIRSNLANVCVPRLDETNCERNLCYNAYFRTMDGTCNNLHHPLRGAAYRPYTRLLPTVYDNALSEPVGSLIPNLRPSPRAITRHLTSSHASVVSEDYNAMVMQFGQFISHDMAKTTLVPSAKCNVCQNITSRCMAVPIEPDDPNAGFRRNGCVRVSRSSPICGSGNQKPRQQLNENTAYIDASPIYGSSVADMSKFRQGNTGFLKLPSFNGMSMLPFDQSKCRSRSSCTVIFTAGDSRVNLFVGLSAWHTMFTREHNRIASTLSRLNPHWNGDRLYQEARKIVGAEVQAIVYREWLPKILGAAFSSVVGDYRGYDPTVDATIANEFTSAAFRFGHGMIQEFYQRLDPNFGNSSFGALALQKGTLHSDVLVNEGGPDPLVRGMFSQNVKRPQRVTTTVTENMFGSTDLSTINIQRGRDHGHPSYTKYRELCGMGIATGFDHLSREILNTATRDKLQKIYGSVDRIDLWVGALLEDPVIRGLVGPTIACIVGPQFKRTRDGDRFYYENPGVFSRPQLSEIRKSSLSRIICDNTNTITMVPREAFRIGHLTACSQIPQMDLNKWKE